MSGDQEIDTRLDPGIIDRNLRGTRSRSSSLRRPTSLAATLSDFTVNVDVQESETVGPPILQILDILPSAIDEKYRDVLRCQRVREAEAAMLGSDQAVGLLPEQTVGSIRVVLVNGLLGVGSLRQTLQRRFDGKPRAETKRECVLSMSSLVKQWRREEIGCFGIPLRIYMTPGKDDWHAYVQVYEENQGDKVLGERPLVWHIYHLEQG
jgi:hypothetical protein